MMTSYLRLLWATALLTIAIIGGLVAATPLQANPKQEELERKIADLALLQQQLGDRLAQAQAMRSSLNEQQTELASEIRTLAKSLKVETLQQADQHLRLHYNLHLLRTILTYMDELDNKIQYYQSGRERLSYLGSLAQDDIRMIATMNDLKIDALTTQISLVINRYLPEAHIMQIDPQQITIMPVQRVWERIMQP
ncbi:MAG: hypothetical protein M0036_24270 [Desulfobacteraceae bacterium]|nr:hypothetical protein [Desulfobacteraceae bacterium]